MRKKKHSEVKYLVQTHRATKRQRQTRNSGSLASEPELLTTTLFTKIQKAIFKEEDDALQIGIQTTLVLNCASLHIISRIVRVSI